MRPLCLFAELICWQQTLFALPWLLCSYLLVLLCHEPYDLSFSKSFEILIAFLLARSAAMSFNRVLDCDIDRLNPRTLNRALPARRISFKQGLSLASSSLIGYLLTSFLIGTRCFTWALGSAPLLVGYSLFKRFSWTCHLVLGLTQALLPVMVGIALQGKIAYQQVLLGLALGLNVSAFDVLYALQDRKCDRDLGLYSIPALFGVKASLNWSRILHGASVATLFYSGLLMHLPWPFFIGCTLLGACLTAGHLLLSRHRGWEMRFFSCGNSLAGLIVFTALLGSYLWEHL